MRDTLPYLLAGLGGMIENRGQGLSFRSMLPILLGLREARRGGAYNPISLGLGGDNWEPPRLQDLGDGTRGYVNLRGFPWN